MKKFFSKAAKPSGIVTGENSQPGVQSAALPNPTQPHTTGLHPKDVLPAVPHPYPHDHLAVAVTRDGLLIRPHIPGLNARQRESLTYLKIAWGKAVKVEEREDKLTEQYWDDAVIVYGIVGVLELFSGSYLLVINAKSAVGNVIDNAHTVYGIKGVTAIPLTETRARASIKALATRNAALSRLSLLQNQLPDANEEPDDILGPIDSSAHVRFSPDTDVHLLSPQSIHFDPENVDNSSQSAQSSSSDLSTHSVESLVPTSPIAKTLASRLSFWSRLSKRNSLKDIPGANDPAFPITESLSTPEQQKDFERLIDEGTAVPAEILENILASTAPTPATVAERHSELESKIVRECVREFTKGGMYFAYNFDITRSLQHKQEQLIKAQKKNDLLAGLGALPSAGSDTSFVNPDKVSALAEPYPTLPLWRRVDKQFWWNEWLSKPFIDAGLHSYVLPIMQGFFQVAKFKIPPDPTTHDTEVMVDYIIASRRSRDRAGLRYQRRGIDDDAHVANFVETETIVRVDREDKENVFSYVQIRGSIPLYWTQTGYGLKPPPVLSTDRTHEQSLEAAKRHFQRIIPHYGPLSIINLAEQHGKEGVITTHYRDCMTESKLKDVHYCEYDFHAETKGMKYEKISNLLNTMERTFESQGFFWISDDTIFSKQKGVFRVNCIDCLDRTNVVQSAFSRYVLNKQLGAIALLNPSITGKTDTDVVFNDVWANNGDSISRAYAGTSALKGDFTRTGKRDLSGMLNDGVNSLARMYTSTFSDWFCQAVIDFMLGNRTISVFSEFLLKLQSTDPRDLIRLSKIRAEAIATSVSRVLPEGERLLSGWTLFAPEEMNVTNGLKFEEKVILLSVKALYIVCYDYTLEKVKLYTRVPLGDIVGIRKGAYILSPLEEASRDPEQNAGFVLTWVNSRQESRICSYSVRNNLDVISPTSPVQSGVRRPASPFSQSLSRAKKSPWVLASAIPASKVGAEDLTFAAFKVLPIDPARIRGSSSSTSGMFAEASDELAGASSCREAVDLIVDSIQRACEDIGSAHVGFVTKEDVVGLAEAQRMTSVYAKMEYGVKRLLWLGG